MRPVYIWLWCCVLLLFVGSRTSADAAISDESRRSIEQLRQRHQSAEAEPARPGFRDLAEQLRKKHEKVVAEQTSAESARKVSSGSVSGNAAGKDPGGASQAATEAEFPVVAGEPQATKDMNTAEMLSAEKPGAAETEDSGCRGADELTAEKYDHLPYSSASSAKTSDATSRPATSQPGSGGASFTGFIGAIFAIMVLFQFGAAMAGSGNGSSASGGVQALGALMLVAGLIVGAATAIKFWPFLLLLFFCSMFSQSKSGSDGCGCGCGLLLLMLFLMTF